MTLVQPRATHRLRLPKFKFIWGGRKVIQGNWRLGLFALYDRVEGRRNSGLAISLRGLLIWCAALAVAAYLAGATALYVLWSRNTYSLLTYGDAVLYPVRRAAISEKKGQA